VRGRLLGVALIASFFFTANVAVAATSPQAQHHAKKHPKHHGAKKHPQHSGAHKKNNKLHTGQ